MVRLVIRSKAHPSIDIASNDGYNNNSDHYL